MRTLMTKPRVHSVCNHLNNRKDIKAQVKQLTNKTDKMGAYLKLENTMSKTPHTQK